MTDQNKYAIIGMCAIVITLYAIRDSHTHYLPDLLGLALALASSRQEYALGAVAVLALIRHNGRLASSLAEGVPWWLLPLLLPAAGNMSISDDESDESESADKAALSPANSTCETAETPQPVAQNPSESITLGETQALARLVASGKIGLTEAVKIGAGAKSGERYQKRSSEIKAELKRIENHFPAGSTQKRFE